MTVDLEPLVPVLSKLYARVVHDYAAYSSAGKRGTLLPPDKMSPSASRQGPLLLKMPDVAEALSISTRSVYALIQNGEIPVVRIGRSVRVSADVLRRWVTTREGQAC